jgi:hypothetical protein
MALVFGIVDYVPINILIEAFGQQKGFTTTKDIGSTNAFQAALHGCHSHSSGGVRSGTTTSISGPALLRQ